MPVAAMPPVEAPVPVAWRRSVRQAVQEPLLAGCILLLWVWLLLLVVYPLVHVFLPALVHHGAVSGAAFRRIFALPYYRTVLANTLILAGIVASLGTLVGFAYAFAVVRVAIPYTAPGILACTILAWIYAWNEFTFTLILARRDAITATVALASFFDLEKVAWGSIAAGSTLTMLPVVMFSLLGRRFLIRGLTGGALKE